MSIAEQINLYLTRSAPAAFCDDCIARALGLSRNQPTQQITNTLCTTSDFIRELDTCSECGGEKRVIRHA